MRKAFLKAALAIVIPFAGAGVVAATEGAERTPPQTEEIVLPEGPASQTLRDVCTYCHALNRVVEKRWSREQWAVIIEEMLNEGADDILEPAAIPPLLDYLAANFGPAEEAAPAP